LITEGSLPPGETPLLITEETLPPGEIPILITEGTLLPGETSLLITEETIPPGETTFLAFENGREFEKSTTHGISTTARPTTTPTTVSTTTTTVSTTTTTVSTTTTNDCCPEYSHRGSPDCYEYCELAAQLEALMAMLAGLTGRQRHRRSQTNQMEELIINNMYTAFIDMEECITFSYCSLDKIKFVHTALTGISQGMKTMVPQSRDFLARIRHFKTARQEQVARALLHLPPYNCTLLENRAVIGEMATMTGEMATMAACLVFKAEATANQNERQECDAKYITTVQELLNCIEKEKSCSTQAWFEGVVMLLRQMDCVSVDAATKAARLVREKIRFV